MTLAPGTTVGRYQILEPLGQGGMATVYKAFQPSLEREVALKVLRPGYAQDAEFRERFEREAKAIARLRHPHIVQVFDFEISSSGEYVLAMEFLEGGTLKDRLTALAQDGRALEPSDAVRIVGEVAEALAYAHEKGVVHRDVKPSNVMLTQKDWAVVTDFGIARILGATSHTQTGVGIGTPEYMAPEQGQGGKVDHRADIYSLGAMAYELLVGRVPYTADTPLAVVIAHIKDPLPLPSTVNATIGPGVERPLLRALAKDPAQRFDSATAFAEALRDGIGGGAVGGTLPTIVVKGGSPVGAATVRAGAPTPAVARSRTGLLIAAGIAFALLVSGALVAGALRTPGPATVAATPGAGPAATGALAPSATPVGQVAPPPAAPATSQAAATLAATATAPGAVVAPPSPTPGASVSPPSGPAGTIFRISWCCFPPNSDVTVVFTHPDGRSVPPLVTKSALDGTAVMGCCQMYFAGTWTVTASGSGVTQVARFTVTQ